jgi:MFS family permease
VSNNVGIALGPVIGGVLAVTSYKLAFYGAAAGMVVYSLLLLLFAVETLPRLKNPEAKIFQPKEKFGGYGDILKDIPFISFIAAFTLVQVCAVLVWVLLGVYGKQNYHVPESQYGLIPITNAIMVVTLQMEFTRVTKRYSP